MKAGIDRASQVVLDVHNELGTMGAYWDSTTRSGGAQCLDFDRYVSTKSILGGSNGEGGGGLSRERGHTVPTVLVWSNKRVHSQKFAGIDRSTGLIDTLYYWCRPRGACLRARLRLSSRANPASNIFVWDMF